MAITSTTGLRNWSKDFSILGANAITAANYGIFWTAPVACIMTATKERHAVAGSDGSPVTLMVKKVPSGTAAGSGTDCLASGINLKGTADTNAAGTLHATPANYTFAAGDSLAIVPTGTLTALSHVSVTIEFAAV